MSIARWFQKERKRRRRLGKGIVGEDGVEGKHVGSIIGVNPV